MTQEEKAKRYDKVFEQAKNWYVDAQIDFKKVLETLFPELKESEDKKTERILHSISSKISFHLRDIFTDEEFQCFDTWSNAWLEKQNGQKITLPKWKYKKDNTTLLKDSLVLNKCGHMAKLSSGAIVSDVWVLDYDELAKLPKEELEKQGEQKPIIEMITPEESLGIDSETYNEIVNTCIFGENKPKFKVSDWIVNRLGNIWHIDSFDAKNYQVTNTKGDHNYFPINIQDRMHLWTIADAKDGDVLVADSRPFIYNGSKNEVTVGAYCGFNVEHKFSFAHNYVINRNITPATKEQRDILFKAITDAGYTFDFEKKELKIIDWNKHIKYEPNAPSIIKENPAWGEEDDHRIKLLEALCEDKLCESVPNSTMYEEMKITIDWLKSIKDRVQPKQE